MYFSLSELGIGAQAMVSHLEGDVADRCRLSELGFVPGTVVQVVSRMPFHGPFVLRIRGAKLAMRFEHVKNIFVYSEE